MMSHKESGLGDDDDDDGTVGTGVEIGHGISTSLRTRSERQSCKEFESGDDDNKNKTVISILKFKPELSNSLRSHLERHFKAKRLDEIVSRLAVPPRYTTLRCVKGSPRELMRKLQDRFEKVGRRFEMCVHEKVRDAVVIESRKYDPKTTTSTVKEVVVGRLCGEAVLRGANVFARGILGISKGTRYNDVVAITVPYEMEVATKGSDPAAFSPCVLVGYGTMEISRSRALKHIKGDIAVRLTSCLVGLHPSLNNLFPSDCFAIGLPSMVVSHVLEPQAQEWVLDLCCGVGGKTTHISSIMKNQGLVLALDQSRQKVKKLRDRCDVLGISNVKAFATDSKRLTDTSSLIKSDTSLKQRRDIITELLEKSKMKIPVESFPIECFDRVLCDPPCTALGLRPRLNITLTKEDCLSMQVFQRHFLRSSVNMLRPGGTLVFSTCTIDPSENEENVRYILDKFPNMKLISQSPFHLAGTGLKSTSLTDKECKLVQRFDPSDIELDTAGFFIAKFIKIVV